MARRAALTPAEYEAAFNEGKDAFERRGENAMSPYLRISGNYVNLAEQTRATAWENGWWFAAIASGDPKYAA